MTATSARSGESNDSPHYDNRITLQKLEVLCAIVELGGYGRAADHLFVAQPVVTAHIKSLEERLGVKLLYRDGQRMRLTPSGERVHRWATETLSATRELVRDLDGMTGGSHGSVAVAASNTVGSYILPPILAAFRSRRSHATITLTVSVPENAVQRVESGDADFAVVIDDGSHVRPSMTYDVIGRERIVLVAAPSFAPGTRSIPLAALAGVPLISSPRTGARQQLVDRQLSRRGVFPREIIIELGHPEAMKRVTQAGLGACLLFESSVAQELNRGSLREIEIRDTTMSVPVIVVSRVGKQLSPVQMQLRDAIRASLSVVVDETSDRGTEPVAPVTASISG